MATGVDYEMKGHEARYEAIEAFDRFVPRLIRLVRLFKRVREFNPEIIHFHGAQHPTAYLVLAAVLRRLTDALFVVSPQDVLSNRHRSHHPRAYRQLYARMSHVFLNAKQNQVNLIEMFGVPEQCTSVLPLPDHTETIRQTTQPVPPDIAPDVQMVLCFGLIEARKGIATLVQAFTEVRAAVGKVHLFIVGQAIMDLEPLYEEVKALDLEASVTVIPRYVSFAEMAGFFERAEVVVLPYHSGWNSGVLVSAQGFGKAIVATTIGGFAEVIEHGRTGLLVPPREVGPLADAVTRVLRDDEFRRQLAMRTQKEAGLVSWEGLASSIENVYQSISEP